MNWIKTPVHIRPLTKGEITKSALIELQYRGFEAWRQNNLAVRGREFIGRKGIGDISGYQRNPATGIRLEVEIKTISDKLSDDQIKFLGEAQAAGCICMIAHEINGKVVLTEFVNPKK